MFVAGMVSLGFLETDPRFIVRKAATLIHPDSPYRQCLDQVIAMASAGKPFEEVVAAVEDRWHLEYPRPTTPSRMVASWRRRSGSAAETS